MALASFPGQGRRYADPTEPFDVILMDIQMPEMDGHEATRRLRQENYTGPIIALSAHATAHAVQQCLDAGCNDYLSKPIDRDKLVNLVAAHGDCGRRDGSVGGGRRMIAPRPCPRTAAVAESRRPPRNRLP